MVRAGLGYEMLLATYVEGFQYGGVAMCFFADPLVHPCAVVPTARAALGFDVRKGLRVVVLVTQPRGLAVVNLVQ